MLDWIPILAGRTSANVQQTLHFRVLLTPQAICLLQNSIQPMEPIVVPGPSFKICVNVMANRKLVQGAQYLTATVDAVPQCSSGRSTAAISAISGRRATPSNCGSRMRSKRSSTSSTARSGVDAPLVTPTTSGPSDSQGCTTPCGAPISPG